MVTQSQRCITDRFVVTNRTWKRLMVSLGVIIFMALYHQAVMPFLSGSARQNVILMAILPLVESTWGKNILLVVNVLAVCYIFLEMRRQFRALADNVQYACLLIIIFKLLSVVGSILGNLMWEAHADGTARLSQHYFYVSNVVNFICSLGSSLGILWLSIVLVRRYAGRLRTAGWVHLVCFVLGATLPILLSFVLCYSPLCHVSGNLLFLLFMVLPPAFYCRAFTTTNPPPSAVQSA